MSAPSWIKTYDKDMNETSHNYHNWGFLAPSDLEAGTKIVLIAKGLNALPGFDYTFEYLEDRCFGLLTRAKYTEMYTALYEIHHNKRDKKTFNFSGYFE